MSRPITMSLIDRVLDVMQQRGLLADDGDAKAVIEVVAEDAADLSSAVYMRLIGGDAQACPCGNGRIPTQAYRTAADAYAKAIRELS